MKPEKSWELLLTLEKPLQIECWETATKVKGCVCVMCWNSCIPEGGP